MKKFIISYSFMVLFSLVLKGQTETEPNQNLSDATANSAYIPGVTYSGSIGMNPPPIDVFDFFRIVLPVDATISFEIEASSSGPANVPVTMYDSQGNAISFAGGGFTAGTTPVVTTFELRCFVAGTYFFQLTPNQGNDIQYSITWNYLPALFSNDTEPNADGTQALSNGLMQNGVWREGHHSYNITEALTDIVDVHALSIPEDGSIEITTIASHLYEAGASLQILLVDSTGQQMNGVFAPVGAFGSTDTTSLSIGCLKNGRYFIVIYGINTCGASYRIRYNFSPAIWQDDMDISRTLLSGQWLEGHQSFNGNGTKPGVDNFSVNIPERHYLRLELISADLQAGGATPDLRVFNSEGTMVSSWYGESGPPADPDTNIFQLGCLPAGDYGISLSHINSCGISYRFRVLIEPPAYGQDTEPNNDISTASLGIANIENGGFLRDSDLDYWQIVNDQDGTFILDFRASTQTDFQGTVFCTVYDLAGNQLDQASVATGIQNQQNAYTSLSFNANIPDTCILRVSYINASCLSYGFRFEGSGVGFEKLNQPNTFLKIVPNSVNTGQFIVEAPELLSNLILLDSRGSILGVYPVINKTGYFDISLLPAGIYLCRAEGKSGRVYYGRFVSINH